MRQANVERTVWWLTLLAISSFGAAIALCCWQQVLIIKERHASPRAAAMDQMRMDDDWQNLQDQLDIQLGLATASSWYTAH